jgi:glycerol-3-phosphate dehydrogenase
MEGDELSKVDILIIGGGITGAGCLLEASMAGFKTTLVEKNDFASGTSSKSSRLVHGGIRYLESYQFGLVKEALDERYWIGHTFPHLVTPLDIRIPLYRGNRRSPLLAALGVFLYDILAGRRKIHKSSIHLGSNARGKLTGIRTEELTSLFVFSDYQLLMPERLVLEHIIAATKAGGEASNYTEVSSISHEDGLYHTRVRHTLSEEESEIRSSVIINAAGPWIDEVRRLAGFRENLLRPTKGVHLEVPRLFDEALFVEAESDGRLFFILPFLKHSIIGATDTDFTGPPESALPTDEDVDYLLSNLNWILEGKEIIPSRIYSAYSGLRPLINVKNREESEVPRKHRVVCEGKGKRFISITGGKLTTFRRMSTDTVKEASRKLMRPLVRRNLSPSYPSGGPYPGDMEAGVRDLWDTHSLPHETASTLFSLYGHGAERVASLAGGDPFLLSPLFPYTGEIPAQVLFALEEEFAQTIEDIVLRRMLSGKSPAKGTDASEILLRILTEYLGRCEGDSRDTIEEMNRKIRKEYCMDKG